MRKYFAVILLAMLIVAGNAALQAQSDDDSADRPLLMAHYMPWYQTPDASGYWGWHWTMDHFDPTQPDANGRPQIASHFMPLTGAYDSQDDAVLEYQVLLMKLSGIDGVIVDWYGIDDFREYAVLNDATVRLFEHIKRAGLRFIICFEDQIYIHMTHDGYLSDDDAIPNAQGVMRYMQEQWFSDPAYLSYDGQPLLFTYGPQYFRNPDNWETIFSVLDTAPGLVTLDKHMDWAALSSYPWPPMAQSGGIELLDRTLERYLTLFYRNAQRHDLIVGSAFPGFLDIYAEAGVRASFGSINPHDGETLRDTLDLALEQNADIVQLVTWNDYGEGTIIEPTEEFGYQYLEIVQETRRALESDFAPTAADLRLPLALFNARRAYAGDAGVNARLDGVFEAIVAGDTKTAAAILADYA